MRDASLTQAGRSGPVIRIITLTLIIAIAATVGSGIVSAENQSEIETDTAVTIDTDTTVTPNESITMVVSSQQVTEWSVEGNVSGWTVVDTDPSTLSTFPDQGSLPYTSADDSDTWGHVYSTTQANASWTLDLRAPTETGEYNLTAVAARDANNTDDTEQTVEISVAEPTTNLSITAFNNQTSLESQSTDIPVEILNDGTAPANETVSLTVAGNATTTREITVQPESTTTVTFDSTSIAKLSPGNYELRVMIGDQESTATLSIEKAHESGVSERTYEAVDKDNSGLSRAEIRDLVRSYVTGEDMSGVSLSRSEVRKLIRYYITA